MCNKEKKEIFKKNLTH